MYIVSIVAKNCVLCVKLLQVSISVSSYKDNITRESKTLTHNHNRLMGIITFEIHLITPTSPRNTLAIIFKSILIFFVFSFLLITSLQIFLLSTMKHIMHGYIREKKIPFIWKHIFLVVQMLHLIEHDFYELHTSVYDWQVLVVRWLFMPFFEDFLVLPIKKSDIDMSKND